MKSDVFYVKENSDDNQQRARALSRLLEAVKPFASYKKDEFIQIKLTIGDSRCVYNINPELVKLIVDHIKRARAKPFLFDTNVIYKGSRTNAVDHLNLAQSKSFGHSRVGAPFIIADGLFGLDGKEYPVESSLIKKIKVPSFVGMLDNLLVLSHLTGHILAGYAGAIKNVAMGMVSRATKQVQHSSLKPHVINERCSGCACCVMSCPVSAVQLKNEKAVINEEACLGCGECLCACKFGAIFINWHEEEEVFLERMTAVAQAVLSKFKNKFFINFAFDITKECDCISTKDEKMITQNFGILASSDILSLDKATMDLAFGSQDEYARKGKILYESAFKKAGQLGLGNPEYNLIEL
jgi:hypothetical protein